MRLSKTGMSYKNNSAGHSSKQPLCFACGQGDHDFKSCKYKRYIRVKHAKNWTFSKSLQQ